METLVRGRVLGRLIMVGTVNLCPTKRMLGFYEWLKNDSAIALSTKVWHTVQTPRDQTQLTAASDQGLHCMLA